MFTARVLGGLSTIVRWVSVIACLFIVLGLFGFLVDTIHDTSKVQATRIAEPGQARVVTVTVDISQPDPPAAVERVREHEHSSAREFIDDVGDVLASPFSWIAKGSEPWVRRLLYSALGLLVYGLLLQILADNLRRWSDEERRRLIIEKERTAAAERKRTGTYQSPA